MDKYEKILFLISLLIYILVQYLELRDIEKNLKRIQHHLGISDGVER